MIGQKNIFCAQSEAKHVLCCLRNLLTRKSSPANSTVSSPPLKKISLARAGEFLREEVSVNSKWALKVYSTSFIRSSCITEEKHLTTNLQTFKAEKMSPARACMSMPSRRKQTRRRFRMNKPRSTLVFTNWPSSSPQADFFNCYIFRFILVW